MSEFILLPIEFFMRDGIEPSTLCISTMCVYRNFSALNPAQTSVRTSYEFNGYTAYSEVSASIRQNSLFGVVLSQSDNNDNINVNSFSITLQSCKNSTMHTSIERSTKRFHEQNSILFDEWERDDFFSQG